jgi:hypothetical protein
MYADHDMPESARQHPPDGEAIPEAIRHEEKTKERPAAPTGQMPEQDTVPVRSSLDKILRHEKLRQRSARKED